MEKSIGGEEIGIVALLAISCIDLGKKINFKAYSIFLSGFYGVSKLYIDG